MIYMCMYIWYIIKFSIIIDLWWFMFFTSIGCHVVFKGPPKRSADRGHTFFSHQPWLSPPHQYPERYRQNLGKAAEIQKTQNTHINQKPFVLMALLLLFIKENALNCFPLLPTYGSPNCWQLKSYLEDFCLQRNTLQKKKQWKTVPYQPNS